MRKFNLLLSVLFVFTLGSQNLHAQDNQTEGFNYISPKPGSKFINPENTIAFRHGDVLELNSLKSDVISVTGSIKGEIMGSFKLSKDQRTLIFAPDQPFALKEKVSVVLNAGIKTVSGLELEGVAFSFSVKEKNNSQMLIEFYKREFEQENSFYMENNGQQSNTTIANGLKSSDDYPEGTPIATITEFDNPAPGYIFCTPRPWQAAPYNPHLMILDNYGTPVFYRQWPRRGNDFKTIVNNQLAYCDFDNSNPEINKYLVMDSRFNITDTLLMGNGYHIDQHDLLMRENGNHFLMAYDPQIVGMDTVVPGGNPAATVVGFIIQELDADHNVIFQWRSWDHFEITDSNYKDFTADKIDYVHGNAFEIDNDGNLLMSCRDMEEITKIDLNTGEIIWRLGLHSQNNMFNFGNDTIGFSWQHDIRRLENGNITVYDNGVHHSTQFSQAVEYQIDEVNFTAELVWNYIHDPVVYGRATGANRRLANNNTFICWGLTWPINYSEVTHDGSLAWELNWQGNVWEYRAFKFDWKTDLFETNNDTIDFGEYDDYVPWPSIIVLTNNSNEDVEITSTHNFTESYSVITTLPLTIPANGTANLTINFFPTQQGQIDDVLTIRSESMYSDTLNQMIACQVFLTGHVVDNNAPEASVNPADGTIDVPLDTQVKISFDESVVNTNGSTLKSTDIPNIIEFRKNDATGDPVENTAYIDAWKKEIVITPNLESNQQYYVELKAGTVADYSGNILTTAVSSTFTTADVEAPIAVFFPTDSSTDVVRNVIVTLTFDEPIYMIGGEEITEADLSAMLSYKENDTLGPDVAYQAMINDAKTEIYLLSNDNLLALQQYYAAFLGNMVQDEAGNILEDSLSITFTTGEEFGMNEFNLKAVVNIFPNPGNGVFNLEFLNRDTKSVSVYNLSGEEIVKADHLEQQTYSFDISGEANGVYIMRVINKVTNSSVELKLIKK